MRTSVLLRICWSITVATLGVAVPAARSLGEDRSGGEKRAAPPASMPAGTSAAPIDLAGIAPLLAEPYDGNRRMAEILERIAAAADPMKNPNMNRQRAEHFKQQLEAAENPRMAVLARFQLARELLHMGDSAGAVRELQHIQSQIDQGGGPAAFPKLAPAVRYELGMAGLRLGEQENCLARHGPESCLLPIRGGGVHTLPRGSRLAIDQFTASLKHDPEDYASRWLLNVAYMTLGEHPDKVPPEWLIPASVFESEYDIKRFPNVAAQLGLNNQNLAGGAIMEDFDRDGDLDIMTSAWGLRDPLRYYVNNADGTFSERSSEARLTGIVGGLNLAHADYNNDGFPDVLVIRGAWLGEEGRHPESLLRNMGDGTFADVTEAAGLLSFHPSHSAAWADYDNDGWLDLFVGHETRPEGTAGGAVVQSGDAAASSSTFGRNRHPCQLYHNNGDGTFAECAAAAGVDAVGFVKGVTWGDYNNDGRSDLYISQLGQGTKLFRNDGPKAGAADAASSGSAPPWVFADVSAAAGVGQPRISFPTWFFDYDNDGWLDLFSSGYAWSSVGDQVRDYQGLPHPAELPRLYRNKGDGTFADVTREAKVNKLLITMGCNFGDLDNDGYPDFYAGTGDPDFRSIVPNRMFRNAGGKFFQDVTTSGGFGHLQKGHGVAFGDIDQDGDQDVFEEMGGALEGDAFQNVLYLNPGHGHHWITLLLEGVRTNRGAIGARIKVRVAEEGGERDIHALVGTGGSFGCNGLQQEIGLGAASAVRFIEVFWPVTKETQRFENVAMDRYYQVKEGEAALVPLERKPIKLNGPE